MTFMIEAEQILKSDARGRVRVPVERQEALLDEFERSGLSGVKFAQAGGSQISDFCLMGAEAQAGAGCLDDGGCRGFGRNGASADSFV